MGRPTSCAAGRRLEHPAQRQDPGSGLGFRQETWLPRNAHFERAWRSPFSAEAQSLILGRIASRSPDVFTMVMVPNSLGPGELIEEYGTPGQQSTISRASPRGCVCLAFHSPGRHRVRTPP